jgi:hypothetical protein
MALHFVGFKDDRVWNALRVFGPPDFWHRSWDARARAEIVEGDIAVFATGSIEDEPKPNAWDDSQADINARTPSYLSCKARDGGPSFQVKVYAALVSGTVTSNDRL